MNWLFIAVSLFVVVFFSFLLPWSLSFFYRDDPPRRFFSSYAAGRRLGGFLHHHEMLLDNLWSFVHNSVRVAPQAAGFCKSWRFDFLAQNYKLLQSNNCLLGCERVMETRAEFHFSLVYTFSAMLSSLQNWANHDRYQLRPSTPVQLCWSSSRLQPFQNNNLIKFAIIQPSTLNHDRNLWNCRGSPDETTCLTVFFQCSSALALICMKLFNVCTNKHFLSLIQHASKKAYVTASSDPGLCRFNVVRFFITVKWVF